MAGALVDAEVILEIAAAVDDLLQSIIIFMVFILLLLTSCAGSGTQSNAELSKYEAAIQKENEHLAKGDRLNAELAQKGNTLSKSFSVADYKIGPEDLLEIDVFQVPELKTTVRVSAKGYIKLPLTDSIEASGLSVGELESLITTKLRKFVNEPVIGVFVKEYRSQQISVLGSVKDPKTYYATGQKYLLDTCHRTARPRSFAVMSELMVRAVGRSDG